MSNSFFESISFHDDNGRMKGGVPVQCEKDLQYCVPLGLVYSPPPFYDILKQEVPEYIPVISDSDFDSLFSLVSNTRSNRKTRKSNTRTTSAR